MNKLSGNKGGSFTVTLIAKDGFNDDLVAVLTLEFECNNTRKDDDPEFCKNCCIGDKKPEEAEKDAAVASVGPVVEVKEEEEKKVEIEVVSGSNYEGKGPRVSAKVTKQGLV